MSLLRFIFIFVILLYFNHVFSQQKTYQGITALSSSIAKTYLSDTVPQPSQPPPGQDSNQQGGTEKLTFADMAPNLSEDEFRDKAAQKTRQFSTYLKILCDKSSGYDELNKAIDLAVLLFVNEDAIVETSSINRNDIRRRKIRAYLTDVKMYRYDKVELEWTSVQYVGDVKKGPDGNYYGVVTFEQVFRGYRDGKIIYQDITRKNANIVLKTYDKNDEGSVKKEWEVLLSDIGVLSTK